MDDDLKALTARMLRKRLFVMLRHPLKPAQAAQHIGDHLRWMIGQERAGTVFASGPFIAEGVAPGSPGSPAGGLTLLRAESAEAARRIAEQDPYVQTGTVGYELREWLVMEGGFTLQVSFADGSYRLD